MLKAKTLMNNNQADKAIPCFEWIRKNDPENCEGMNLYADCLTSTGQTDDVYTLANDLLLATENRPEPYLVLASVWDSGAQKEKALTLYKKVIIAVRCLQYLANSLNRRSHWMIFITEHCLLSVCILNEKEVSAKPLCTLSKHLD